MIRFLTSFLLACAVVTTLTKSMSAAIYAEPVNTQMGSVCSISGFVAGHHYKVWADNMVVDDFVADGNGKCYMSDPVTIRNYTVTEVTNQRPARPVSPNSPIPLGF